MREPKSIVSYQTTEYGHVKVTLANVMDARGITRNRLRTLTGVKYDVIDRYYKGHGHRFGGSGFLGEGLLCIGLHG